MGDSLHLRPVESADAEWVRAVYERAMRDADAYLPGADHADLDAPAAAYANGAFLVGETDGEIVATGGIRPVDVASEVAGDGADAATVEMKRVAVHPAFQGEGHGRAVVRALEAAARDRAGRAGDGRRTGRRTGTVRGARVRADRARLVRRRRGRRHQVRAAAVSYSSSSPPASRSELNSRYAPVPAATGFRPSPGTSLTTSMYDTPTDPPARMGSAVATRSPAARRR
jgi:predicted N-acetyltransferase YhbS